MYLSCLSVSILKLCDARNLSYEKAAALCDLSSRFFGDIARGNVSPRILTLEKICNGFNLTPNELLLPDIEAEALQYRRPLRVIHIICYRAYSHNILYPLCPRCGVTLEREYQKYCDRCGQCLDWADLSKATIVVKNMSRDIL